MRHLPRAESDTAGPGICASNIPKTITPPCAQAYYSAAKRFHPDKAAAAGLTPEEAEARFRGRAEAYEVLAGLLAHSFLLHSPSAIVGLCIGAYNCNMMMCCPSSLCMKIAVAL